MHHIFIKTPLYKNSNFIPHIIEHCVIPESKTPKEYFKNTCIRSYNYTYYSNFTVESEGFEALDALLKNINTPVDTQRVKYEQQVIKDELTEMSYQKKVINKIGEKIYGTKLKYSQTHKVSLAEIQNYQQQYYHPENIIILERDKKEQRLSIDFYEARTSFEIQLKNGREKVFIFDMNIGNLFITSLLGELFEQYLQYQSRNLKANYFVNEVFVGDFEEFIFLSIEKKKDFAEIQQIPLAFINEFIQYKIQKFETIDFTELDGVSMLQFGFTLCEISKRQVINNIALYYSSFQKKS